MAVNPGPSQPNTSTSSKYSFIDRYVASTALTRDELNTPDQERTRRILGINMRRVEHDRIKNENIHIFFGVADIIDSIRSRQFQWLRKLTRQPDSLPTKRLLCAWAPAARQGGAQFITLRTARSTAQLSDSSLVRLYEVRVGLSQRVIESCSITRRLERGGEK
jgi:hypothetical protein